MQAFYGARTDFEYIVKPPRDPLGIHEKMALLAKWAETLVAGVIEFEVFFRSVAGIRRWTWFVAGKEIAIKRYVVRLTAEERDRLEAMIEAGKHPSKLLTRARLLPKADVSEAGEPGRRITGVFSQLPAVLAFGAANQTLKKKPNLSSRPGATKQSAKAIPQRREIFKRRQARARPIRNRHSSLHRHSLAEDA